MSRTTSRRRTPAELIWGWGTNGDRHPGILERLEKVEKLLCKQNRVLYVVLMAVLADLVTNSQGQLLHYLQTAYQIALAVFP